MSDLEEYPQTFIEACEDLRKSCAELRELTLVPLVEPVVDIVSRLLNGKPKNEEVVEYPDYFFSDEELAFIEQIDGFAQRVAAMGWTMEEVVEAWSRLYRAG